MPPDVEMMIDAVLLESHHRRDKGKKNGQDIRILRQHAVHAGRDKKTVELGAEPFRRHKPEPFPFFMQGRGGLRDDPEIIRPGKAQRPHQAQRVFLKPPPRLPHRPQQAVFEVGFSPEGIPQPPLRMPGHGVDGKIAAGQVIAQAGGETDAVRAAVVAVRAIYAVGGDLQRQPVQENRQRPVGDPGFDETEAGKYRFHLFRQSGGADIPIVRNQAEQAVPHAPAHGVSLKALFLQKPDSGGHLLRTAHRVSSFHVNFWSFFQNSSSSDSRR